MSEERDWMSITHKELIDECVEKKLIERPKLLHIETFKNGSFRTYDKLWRKRELIEMLGANE